MKKLLRAAQIVLLPLHLLASNQIFEAGSMVRLANPSAGINEAYWLFESSDQYFVHYPSEAVPVGYDSYFEKGSYTLNSLGNNEVLAELIGSAYVTRGEYGNTEPASRDGTVTLTSPFSATYTGTRAELGGGRISFSCNLTIYPAQDYAPEALPIGSVVYPSNGYHYSGPYNGPETGGAVEVLSSNILRAYDSGLGYFFNVSYSYTKLGPNLGRISLGDPAGDYYHESTLFFVSPTEVYEHGNTRDEYVSNSTDWGAKSVTYPSSYSPPAIFPAPSALPQDQILQITGTNSDLSLNLAGGTWTDASGGSGSFTYTYAVQSGGVAGLTLNRIIQHDPAVPASPEHFALRFTDDGVGEVAYSSLDGSQSFNLVDAPTWEVYDDFSGSTIDTQKWETWYWPGGQAPFISNGQLRLENGGGSGRKDAAFMSTLQSAGFASRITSATYHSGVAFTDPSIIVLKRTYSYLQESPRSQVCV